jgi:hypothetical protein
MLMHGIEASALGRVTLSRVEVQIGDVRPKTVDSDFSIKQSPAKQMAFKSIIRPRQNGLARSPLAFAKLTLFL